MNKPETRSAGQESESSVEFVSSNIERSHQFKALSQSKALLFVSVAVHLRLREPSVFMDPELTGIALPNTRAKQPVFLASHFPTRTPSSSPRLHLSSVPGSSAAPDRAAVVSKLSCSPNEDVVNPKRARSRGFEECDIVSPCHASFARDLSLLSIPCQKGRISPAGPFPVLSDPNACA